MNTCSNCTKWVTVRRIVYADVPDAGFKVIFAAPEGKGECQEMNILTSPEFGCILFKEGDGTGRVVDEVVNGKPWEHWEMIECPDCQGKGANRFCRCCATGKVRKYIDGYIGEERTRLHPLEPKKEPKVDPATTLQHQPKVDVTVTS